MKRQYTFFSIIYFLYILFNPIYTHSQGIFIAPGGNILASGASTIQITDGNFVNDGTYTNGTETLIMTGTSAATMSGTSDTKLFKLSISNTGGVTTKLSQLTADSLIIGTSSRLTIDTTKLVNILTTVTNNAGTNGILIKANANAPNGSLIFQNANESPVQATVEMYSKAYCTVNGSSWTNLKWQFFGIPVKTTAISPTFSGSYIRKHNEAGTGSGLGTDKRWIQLTGGSVTSLQGYEIVQPAAKTFYIKGELVNSPISKSLSYTSGAEFTGQHVLGNPYTASIDIKQIVFGSQTEESIYQYNTGSLSDWTVTSGGDGINPGQYTVSTSGTAGDEGIPRYIPSMQGFVVKAMSNDIINATISIPYSSSNKNTTQQRVAKAKTENSYLVIDAKGEKYSDKMWLYSNPECTRNFDNGWDGRKFYGSYLCPQIYGSELDDNYQIDVVDDINNTIIGFVPGIDTLYTLTFNQYNTASTYPALYLEDIQTNTITDISKNGASYSFKTTEATTVSDRFKITTSPGLSTFSTNQEIKNLTAYYSNKQIYINNTSNDSGLIKIIDLSGRIINQYEITTYTGNKTYPLNLKQGIYLCQISTSKNKLTKSFIVK